MGGLVSIIGSILNVKALVGNFNTKKVLVGGLLCDCKNIVN